MGCLDSWFSLLLLVKEAIGCRLIKGIRDISIRTWLLVAAIMSLSRSGRMERVEDDVFRMVEVVARKRRPRFTLLVWGERGCEVLVEENDEEMSGEGNRVGCRRSRVMFVQE